MATMPETVALVGGGRVGTALAGALRAAGRPVIGPLGREEIVDADVVLLCVPDGRIAEVAAQFSGRARYIGHVSGATPLSRLASAGVPMFGIHPAQTFAGQDGPERFHGVGAAIAGSTPEALRIADELATAIGMRPFEIDETHRAAYHAAACVASNFLLTIADAAEQLAAGAGLDPAQSRELFGPLVRTTVANWFAVGPRAALTGPVERGDTATVDRQRAAVREMTPGLIDLFEALVVGTENLAARPVDAPTRIDNAVPATYPLPTTQALPGKSPDERRAMRTIRTIVELREFLGEQRRSGRTIGLVPTMGFFHAGHLALMTAARNECDVVVVSLFVNPTQFGPTEDLDAYPRNEERDFALAAGAGVDVLFAPSPAEVYPAGFATTITVSGLTEVLCGDPRRRGPAHFGGVTQVVGKLLNIVGPDVAYFGQKDAQQALVIRRMVADLNFPVRVEVLPTIRENDGLAMSSRNSYLTPDERQQATALNRALSTAEQSFHQGERSARVLENQARDVLVAAGIEVEYVELRAVEDLSEMTTVDRPGLLAMAARVGRTRLIDNRVLGENGPGTAPVRESDSV